MAVRTVKVGGVPLGDGHPPVFLAEIGALFNRDLDLAGRLIEAVAKSAGPDSPLPLLLKGEILHDPSICLEDSTVETFRAKGGAQKQERYRDLIARKALSFDEYRQIFQMARDVGLKVVMSVYDFEGADFAASESVAAIKVASSNLTHLPLIRHLARLGIPMFIDNGRASLAEVDRAVRVAREAGCEDIILQHSPDGHPAPPVNHNLQSLVTLKSSFGLPVGLSDHHTGSEMLILAIGLDVNLLEKNIVADDQALEQDYAIAMRVDDLPTLLVKLRDCWVAIGAPWRDLRNRHGLIATSARMGIVTSRPVLAGEAVSLQSVRFAFPLKGIGVECFDQIEGWKFTSNISAGECVTWQNVRP